MVGKSIPLNNGQRKERIFVVTGCSWYLDEMEGMHVSCHSNRVTEEGEQQPSYTLFCRKGLVEHLLFCPQEIATLGSQAYCSHWHMWNSCC